MCGLVVWQLQPPRKTGDPAVGYALSCLLLSGPKRPREAQRGPEKPKEPQRHRDSQRGPERPREAQRGPCTFVCMYVDRPREAERGQNKPVMRLAGWLGGWLAGWAKKASKDTGAPAVGNCLVFAFVNFGPRMYMRNIA